LFCSIIFLSSSFSGILGGGSLNGEAFTRSFPTFIKIFSLGGWEDSMDVLSGFVHFEVVRTFKFFNFG
jgi:hypothetical protein